MRNPDRVACCRTKRAQRECLLMVIGKRHLTVKSLVPRHSEVFGPPRHGHVAGHVNAGHGHANRVPSNVTEASPATRAGHTDDFCVVEGSWLCCTMAKERRVLTMGRCAAEVSVGSELPRPIRCDDQYGFWFAFRYSFRYQESRFANRVSKP
jgi:hypothetical protein